MNAQTPEAEPPIVELSPAPEILVDGYATTMLANGIARFTFFTMGHDPATGETQRRVVLRLSASLPAVDGIQQAMAAMIDEVRRNMVRSDP